MRAAIRSACPSCGVVAVRETYDIGSGRELSCANCEWCWGADGQDLKPAVPTINGVPLTELSVAEVRQWAQDQAIESARKQS